MDSPAVIPKKRVYNKDKYFNKFKISTSSVTNESNTTQGNIVHISDSIDINTLNPDLLKSLRGYGISTHNKNPSFDNDPHKFANFQSQLMHYLLVNGLYYHIQKK